VKLRVSNIDLLTHRNQAQQKLETSAQTLQLCMEGTLRPVLQQAEWVWRSNIAWCCCCCCQQPACCVVGPAPALQLLDGSMFVIVVGNSQAGHEYTLSARAAACSSSPPEGVVELGRCSMQLIQQHDLFQLISGCAREDTSCCMDSSRCALSTTERSRHRLEPLCDCTGAGGSVGCGSVIPGHHHQSVPARSNQPAV
jgi:hypothetical protein